MIESHEHMDWFETCSGPVPFSKRVKLAMQPVMKYPYFIMCEKDFYRICRQKTASQIAKLHWKHTHNKATSLQEPVYKILKDFKWLAML